MTKFSTHVLYFLIFLQNFVSKLYDEHCFSIFPPNFNLFYFLIFYKFGHMSFLYYKSEYICKVS